MFYDKIKTSVDFCIVELQAVPSLNTAWMPSLAVSTSENKTLRQLKLSYLMRTLVAHLQNKESLVLFPEDNFQFKVKCKE